MGAPVTPDRVVSSARATALYLAESSSKPRCALVVGGPGLVHELRDVGIEVMPSGEAAERWTANGRDAAAATRGVDTVVVGLDLEFTYARLAVAAEAVRAGARFVATNRDPIYPLERGMMPGAGSVVAAIVTASGVEPVSIGKPGPLLLEVAAHALGRPVTEAVMIGDSLITDIPAAIAVGARSVLMLTGISTAAQLDDLPAAERPTEVAANADELAAALDRLTRAWLGAAAGRSEAGVSGRSVRPAPGWAPPATRRISRGEVPGFILPPWIASISALPSAPYAWSWGFDRPTSPPVPASRSRPSRA
jgi:4-nitrophenyl phosphatase